MCYSGQLATKWRYGSTREAAWHSAVPQSAHVGRTGVQFHQGTRGLCPNLWYSYNNLWNVLIYCDLTNSPQNRTYSHLNRKGSVAFTSLMGVAILSLAVCRFVCSKRCCAKGRSVKSIRRMRDVEQRKVSVDVPDFLDRCPKGSA